MRTLFDPAEPGLEPLERLRRYLVRSGRSQSELAAELGVSRQALWGVLRPRRNRHAIQRFGLLQSARLACVMGLPVRQLLEPDQVAELDELIAADKIGAYDMEVRTCGRGCGREIGVGIRQGAGSQTIYIDPAAAVWESRDPGARRGPVVYVPMPKAKNLVAEFHCPHGHDVAECLAMRAPAPTPAPEVLDATEPTPGQLAFVHALDLVDAGLRFALLSADPEVLHQANLVAQEDFEAWAAVRLEALESAAKAFERVGVLELRGELESFVGSVAEPVTWPEDDELCRALIAQAIVRHLSRGATPARRYLTERGLEPLPPPESAPRRKAARRGGRRKAARS